MSAHPDLRNERIAAFDYGNKRIGVAVCDEMHITVGTRPFITNDENVWDAILKMIETERVAAIIVGVPRHHDDRETEIIKTIEEFIKELKTKVPIPVLEMDEAFSTQRAQALMRVTGSSKKRRSQKGRKDEVAAAIILQDYLQEHQAR